VVNGLNVTERGGRPDRGDELGNKGESSVEAMRNRRLHGELRGNWRASKLRKVGASKVEASHVRLHFSNRVVTPSSSRSFVSPSTPYLFTIHRFTDRSIQPINLFLFDWTHDRCWRYMYSSVMQELDHPGNEQKETNKVTTGA
jgi:hypothetical protein